MTVAQLFVLFGIKPQGWGKANKLVQQLRSMVRRYIAVESVKDIIGFVDSVTEAATHLISLSTAMGMSVEQTQEWGYVAQQSGSTVKELSMGVNMLLRNLDKFGRNKGGKELAHQFKELGLSASDAKLAMSGSDGFQTVLLKMSDHLKAMGKDSKTLEATMTSLMGVRAGRAMLADMSRGSDALKQMFARRKEMGEITGAEANSLRDLHNHMQDLKTQFNAIASKIVAELAPKFIEMAEAARKWMSENRDLISGSLAAALTIVSGLVKGLAAAFELLGYFVRGLFEGKAGSIAVAIGVLTAIALAINDLVIPSLMKMAAAAWASAGPYVLIAAAIAGIIYLILKIGPILKQAFVDTWNDDIKPAFDEIADDFNSVIDTIENLGASIGHGIGKAADFIKEKLGAALDWVRDKAHEVWNDVKQLPIIGQVLGAAETVFGGTSPMDLAKQMANGGMASRTAPAVNVSVPRGQGSTSVTVQNSFKIDGAQNPAQTATKVADHLDNTMRHAMRGVGGER